MPAETLVQTSINTTETGWVNIEPSVVPEDHFEELQRLGSPVPLRIGSARDEGAFIYVPGSVPDPSDHAAHIHLQFDPLSAGAGDAVRTVNAKLLTKVYLATHTSEEAMARRIDMTVHVASK